MVDWYNDYMFWFPEWYGIISILLLMPMGYTFVWGVTDRSRFGSGYYTRNAIKGLVGFVLCVFFLWPIPVVIFLVRLPGRWRMSEFEEMQKFERRKKAYSTSRDNHAL